MCDSRNPQLGISCTMDELFDVSQGSLGGSVVDPLIHHTRNKLVQNSISSCSSGD